METNEQESETLNFEVPSYTFKPNEAHEWRQQSIYLVCKSCELIHAVYIGMDKMMVGTKEDGTPILVNRKDYEKEWHIKKTK